MTNSQLIAPIVVLGLALGALAQPAKGPHQIELERHRDAPVLDALIGQGGRPSMPSIARARRLASQNRVVFGYLPYWIDADYYRNLDFDLLTHVSAFSLEVEPDGTIGNAHGWPWTALVDSAHAHGVYVIVTATLFGDSEVLSVIGDKNHRQTFFRQIRDRIIEGGADGVNIDFEGPGANGWPALINDFMAELTDFLHREIPGCQVSFAAPPVDWAGRWDFPGLADSCDYLFIMGYAFAGSWSQESGPTAPLTGGWRNITTTLQGASDYGEATRRSPEKLILGVPYYGCQWKTAGPQARNATVEFVNYPTVLQTLPGAAVHGRMWDEFSSTPWYRYQEEGQWYQVWYDDPASLGLKFDLALQANLLGVGMWALGYEGDRREPWDLLAAKMGARVPATAVSETPQARDRGLVQNYPNPFNGATHISYDIDGAGSVIVQIFDAGGRAILPWRAYHGESGRYGWWWNGGDGRGQPVASGVYFYRLVFTGADGQSWRQTRRMVLVR
ncbi:MAG: hypothetical protein GKR89_19200 [Candidatus Latescibacteria bacterium]|nr:hypothetical protein [Candidatus Latescibacterota bacterium]